MHSAFTRIFHVRWGDMDFNAHMRNTAYLDMAGDVRMMFFQENGFPMAEFAKRMIGPVISRDEVEYFREMRLLDRVIVDLQLAGLSPDAARFRIRNSYFREDGKPVARVTSTGGWLDLGKRVLVPAPDDLRRALESLGRTEDFAELAPLKSD